jgi:hypothetical protein
MVACGAGDNALCLLFLAEHGDFIAGAAKLEGTGSLQVFGFEVQGEILGKAVSSCQRGGTDDIFQNQRCMEYFVNGQHISISFQKGFSKYLKNYTIEWKGSQAKGGCL